jgi:hypothetical protein
VVTFDRSAGSLGPQVHAGGANEELIAPGASIAVHLRGKDEHVGVGIGSTVQPDLVLAADQSTHARPAKQSARAGVPMKFVGDSACLDDAVLVEGVDHLCRSSNPQSGHSLQGHVPRPRQHVVQALEAMHELLGTRVADREGKMDPAEGCRWNST